jgi:hypothetical protein
VVKKKDEIQKSYSRRQEPNWNTLYTSAVKDYPTIVWNGPKEIKEFVLQRLKNEMR